MKGKGKPGVEAKRRWKEGWVEVLAREENVMESRIKKENERKDECKNWNMVNVVR